MNQQSKKGFKIGVIDGTSLNGRKIILEPRQGLALNEYLVESEDFISGSPTFSKYCLVCEVRIPNSGCPTCGKSYGEK